MSESLSHNTAWIADRLGRLQAGDEAAREQLTSFAVGRFERLAHSMLRGQFGRVGRWVDTNDVLQSATLRLWKALAEAAPESPRHFYRLAARLIRHELYDLARHFYGPLGSGAHHESLVAEAPGSDAPASDPLDARPGQTPGPEGRPERADVHALVQALPEEEAEVVDLIFYQGLSQEEAAAAIGVDVRTIQRRWQRVRRKLGESLAEM